MREDRRLRNMFMIDVEAIWKRWLSERDSFI